MYKFATRVAVLRPCQAVAGATSKVTVGRGREAITHRHWEPALVYPCTGPPPGFHSRRRLFENLPEPPDPHLRLRVYAAEMLSLNRCTNDTKARLERSNIFLKISR